jgi:hypothetical protein
MFDVLSGSGAFHIPRLPVLFCGEEGFAPLLDFGVEHGPFGEGGVSEGFWERSRPSSMSKSIDFNGLMWLVIADDERSDFFGDWAHISVTLHHKSWGTHVAQSPFATTPDDQLMQEAASCYTDWLTLLLQAETARKECTNQVG